MHCCTLLLIELVGLMGTLTPEEFLAELTSPTRRRFLRLFGTVTLAFAPIVPNSARADVVRQEFFTANPEIQVNRFVCEQDFCTFYGEPENTQKTRLISVIGSGDADDVEAELLRLYEGTGRGNGEHVSQSRWSRLDNGPPSGLIGLVLMLDISEAALKLLAIEAQLYRSHGIDLFIGCVEATNTNVVLEFGKTNFVGPWRMLKVETQINEEGYLPIKGMEAYLLAYLEAVIMPPFSACMPCLDYSDIKEVFEEPLVHITELRSSTIGGIKEMIENELEHYSSVDSIFLSVYWPRDDFKLSDSHELMSLLGKDILDCACRRLASNTEKNRHTFVAYFSSCANSDRINVSQ